MVEVFDGRAFSNISLYDLYSSPSLGEFHVGGVRKASLMPPLEPEFLLTGLFLASSFRNTIELKLSSMEERSLSGISLRSPKKAEGVGARETERVLTPVLGLDAVLGSAPGLKALAAGFGLNSIALTLNLADVADVGLRMPFIACGLETPLPGTDGRITLWRASCIGRGFGAGIVCMFAL